MIYVNTNAIYYYWIALLILLWILVVVDVFWGYNPNIMGTVETGSGTAFQKGVKHFCSSNFLASAGIYFFIADGQMERTTEHKQKILI